MSCRADGCTNRPSMQRSLQFFRFPSAEQDADRLLKWLVNMRRQDWKPTKSARLCSLHFEDHAFTTDSKGNRRLKNTAVPTVFALPGRPVKKPARRRPMVSSDAEVKDVLLHFLPQVLQERTKRTAVQRAGEGRRTHRPHLKV